ncbi:hypothetical protein DXJ48_00210 [Salmonella enterica]|nr:hypothetical protein [Salmonella enterica]
MDYARRWRAYSGGGLMAAWFLACRFATDIQQCTAKRGVKHGPVAQARVMLQGRVNAVVLKRSLTFRYGKQRQTLANRCKSLHYNAAISISFSYIFSIFNQNKV